jgi:hypothetical protein
MPKIIQKSVYRTYTMKDLWEKLRKLDDKFAEDNTNEELKKEIKEIIKELQRRGIKIKVSNKLG